MRRLIAAAHSLMFAASSGLVHCNSSRLFIDTQYSLTINVVNEFWHCTLKMRSFRKWYWCKWKCRWINCMHKKNNCDRVNRYLLIHHSFYKNGCAVFTCVVKNGIVQMRNFSSTICILCSMCGPRSAGMILWSIFCLSEWYIEMIALETNVILVALV